jgi:hypothetical protein
MWANNQWELYSSKPGWEAIQTLLTDATTAALLQADVDVANGATHHRAALNAIIAVRKVMHTPKASGYGAWDLQPMRNLYWLIEQHFKKRYNVEIEF